MLYTATEVAEQINATKPDFKYFKELFRIDDVNKFKEDFDNTSCVFQKILKAQIICCYRQTHSRFWIDIKNYKEFLFYNAKDMGVLKRTRTYDKVEYIDLDNTYFINSSFDSSTQVAGNLVDVQNYIPKYLWNKVRTKTTVTDIKKLEPNEFSLVTFKNYLGSLKKELPSTRAIDYVKQIGKFNDIDIQEKFIGVLNDHLTQPSIELQKELSSIVNSTYNLTKKTKYISLNRYPIRGLASKSQILVNESILDNSDSQYKPYITNVKRKPTTDIREFTALMGTLLVFKTSIKSNPNEGHQYFAECLMEHLKEPGYEKVRTEYLETLKNTKESIEEILNGFI